MWAGVAEAELVARKHPFEETASKLELKDEYDLANGRGKKKKKKKKKKKNVTWKGKEFGVSKGAELDLCL